LNCTANPLDCQNYGYFATAWAAYCSFVNNMVNSTNGLIGMLENTGFNLSSAINNTYGLDYLMQTLPKVSTAIIDVNDIAAGGVMIN
jgi:hypothetical protein